jgi:hypothetical protein
MESGPHGNSFVCELGKKQDLTPAFENGAFTAALGFVLNQAQSCPHGQCKQTYEIIWKRLLDSITKNSVTQFVGDVAGQATDGVQVEGNVNAMVAAGLGVSTSTALVNDFNYSTKEFKTCMVTTVCGVAGPILGSTTGVGIAGSTGTLTRGEVVWQFGLTGTATALVGGRFDPAIASNGSLTIGVSQTMGLAIGGAVTVCRQATSKSC